MEAKKMCSRYIWAMKVLGMLHYSLILAHCIHVDITDFYSSSCQVAQFFRSKNRQKGDQFFNQMSDFCENCNPVSYHTSAVGECLDRPNIDLQKHVNWLSLHFWRFLSVWKMGVYCMLKQAVWSEHAVLYVNLLWSHLHNLKKTYFKNNFI